MEKTLIELLMLISLYASIVITIGIFAWLFLTPRRCIKYLGAKGKAHKKADSKYIHYND